jgi:hypothetical protein
MFSVSYRGKILEWPASCGPGMKMNLLLLTRLGNSDRISPNARNPSATVNVKIIYLEENIHISQ